VCAQHADLLRTYGISRVRGDNYAAGLANEAYRKVRVTFDQTAPPKTQLYLSLLARLNSQTIRLLDSKKLID